MMNGETRILTFITHRYTHIDTHVHINIKIQKNTHTWKTYTHTHTHARIIMKNKINYQKNEKNINLDLMKFIFLLKKS
jgi:hypothetical protein